MSFSVFPKLSAFNRALSTRFRNYSGASGNRSLTVAAQKRAVREQHNRSLQSRLRQTVAAPSDGRDTVTSRLRNERLKTGGSPTR
jgi:hypothetical protein